MCAGTHYTPMCGLNTTLARRYVCGMTRHLLFVRLLLLRCAFHGSAVALAVAVVEVCALKKLHRVCAWVDRRVWVHLSGEHCSAW